MFYGQWSIEHLVILLLSIFINFGAAKILVASQHKKALLTLIIILNLLPLIYYKYSEFLSLQDHSIILPLAISFFTFQQIAFQIDLYRNKIILRGVREYLFFILFFPQLIAGPIVHYNELIPQMLKHQWLRFNAIYFQMGIVLFSIGLFKKVVLADNLSVIANNAFSNNLSSSYDAWMGIFAYSFQIYFDFSGYADMAIGLGLLFGLRLPINFNSPYKSKNIIVFWRNWHITLSNFLKDYIYIPLGGNRTGQFRNGVNIVTTMIIGGIWHGAGWNFLLWGFLHGVFLAITHLFEKLIKKIVIHSLAVTYLSTMITFLLVTLLWVLFRAKNIDAAMEYYRTLFIWKKFSFGMDINLFLLACSFVVVFFLPNSTKFANYFEEKPVIGVLHTFIAAVMIFISLKMMALKPAATFVYFNF
ncbi:MAG: MBOAT family protein [Thiovulaceae bacterium]|nr:MBOAT family protein [Sulfurimonadaceae bacterium]